VIRFATTTAAACLALALSAGRVGAQTGVQIPLQFDFLNPGAKSLALGGAFVGLADDATATFANPAGLTLLGGSEVSVEFRGGRIDTEFLRAGRLSGTITNIGTDTIQGPAFGDSTGTHSGIGYLSFVYAHPSHRWVVAAYRHELARIDQGFTSNGVFQQEPGFFTSSRDSPQTGTREVSITGYGVSGSVKLRPDLSVGAGLAIYTFTLDSLFRRGDVGGFFDAPNFDVQFGRATQSGDDTAAAPIVGVLWDRGRARVGAMFRKGASFAMSTQDAPANPVVDGRFRVPDTLGVGASIRVKPQLIVAGEVTYISYSRLVTDFIVDQAQGFGHAADFSIDNGTEVHVGAQYAVQRQGRSPIRLRAGAWFDPDHSVHFATNRPPLNISDKEFVERISVALSRGKNQLHATGGVGINLSSRFEFNAGVDIASTHQVISASIIAHVGKEN